MASPNVNNPNDLGVGPIPAIQPFDTTLTPEEQAQLDTLMTAEQQILDSEKVQVGYQAAIPFLIQAIFTNGLTYDQAIQKLKQIETNIVSITDQLTVANQNMIKSMLTAWINNLAEIEKEERQYLKSDAHQQQLRLNDPTIISLTESTHNSMQNLVKNDNVAGVLGLLMIGATMASGIPVATQSAEAIVNIVNSTLQQVVTLVPGNMAAELGLLGTLMITTVVARASLDSLTGALQNGNVDPMAYAKNLAKQVIGLFNSISGDASKQPQLYAVLKAVIALATLYMTKLGGLTEQELEDLISGKITPASIANGDPELQGLISQLVAILSENKAVLPPHVFNGILSAVVKYIKDNKGKGSSSVNDLIQSIVTYVGNPETAA